MGEDFSPPSVCQGHEEGRQKPLLVPYTSAGGCRDTLDLIHKLYPDQDLQPESAKRIRERRPCLNYHIKQYDPRARVIFPGRNTSQL